MELWSFAVVASHSFASSPSGLLLSCSLYEWSYSDALYRLTAIALLAFPSVLLVLVL